MVSSQAHNLVIGVRFAFLQMFYILCSTVLLLLFFCRNKLKDYWTYLFVALSMPLIIIFQANYDSFHNFLSIPDWKFVVIGIIGLLFIGTKLVAKGSGFETSVLTLLLLLGSILVVVSEHLIIIYLAIELQTFCVFILIAKNRDSLKGAEAALKYFILGAISSGVLLLGVSLLLAESSLLTLEALRSDWLSSSILLQVGAALITLSLVFKLAAAPLHFWIPDIYEGSSWDTIAIVSTITKISVIVVLQQIGFDNNFLIGVILLSLIVGTFGALNQTKLKRLLGYSGVNHMGFILIGLLILGVHGYESTHSYLVIYFASMFTILGLSSVKEELKDIFLVELGLYHNTNNILAFLSMFNPFISSHMNWE